MQGRGCGEEVGERCAVCRSRKPARSCPAKAAAICAHCCGAGRRRTIDCPDDCRFFVTARRQALVRLAGIAGDLEFERQWFEVLNVLRQALLDFRRTDAATLDWLAAGIANAAETARVRTSGLIYDFKSTDPRVQKVADALGQVAAGFGQGRSDRPRIEPVEMARCLRYVERQTRAAAERGMSAETYFDLLCQSVSRRSVQPGPSIR
uniref:Uncharacterized protein n=1 Tax=candidate division WOR-3 bacterium TaxID=2052148 RepID=A0A7C4CBK8_UNCW3